MTPVSRCPERWNAGIAWYCAIPQTGLHCTDFTYIAQHRGCSGSAVLLLDDTVQFRKRTLHLQELYSSARAEPKLAKMLREEIMCVAFLLRQSACFSSLWLCISKLHCADVYYIAQYRSFPVSAALLSDDTVQFRKRTLNLQELYSSSKAKPKLGKCEENKLRFLHFAQSTGLLFLALIIHLQYASMQETLTLLMSRSTELYTFCFI